MVNLSVLDEARDMAARSGEPVYAVAAALQLGYWGDHALHVARIIRQWVERYYPALREASTPEENNGRNNIAT
jgi:hypothetical protein